MPKEQKQRIIDWYIPREVLQIRSKRPSTAYEPGGDAAPSDPSNPTPPAVITADVLAEWSLEGSEGATWTYSLPSPLQANDVIVQAGVGFGEIVSYTPEGQPFVFSGTSWMQYDLGGTSIIPSGGGSGVRGFACGLEACRIHSDKVGATSITFTAHGLFCAYYTCLIRGYRTTNPANVAMDVAFVNKYVAAQACGYPTYSYGNDTASVSGRPPGFGFFAGVGCGDICNYNAAGTSVGGGTVKMHGVLANFFFEYYIGTFGAVGDINISNTNGEYGSAVALTAGVLHATA